MKPPGDGGSRRVSDWGDPIRILAVSAHPDDETLGCGGTLLRHRVEGHRLFWLVATSAFEPVWPSRVVRAKEREVRRVADAYGMAQVFRLGYPAARLDTLPLQELVDRIREVLAEIRPEWVYVVHGGDAHTDHRIVHGATLAALKPFTMGRYAVRRILSGEILSSTGAGPARPEGAFAPNVFSDITPFLKRKLAILRMYRSEIHRDLLPRAPSAVAALARYRGAEIGVRYAEAFVLERERV